MACKLVTNKVMPFAGVVGASGALTVGSEMVAAGNLRLDFSPVSSGGARRGEGAADMGDGAWRPSLNIIVEQPLISQHAPTLTVLFGSSC
jgi:hypothetical protein